MKVSDIPTRPILMRLWNMPSHHPWAVLFSQEDVGPEGYSIVPAFPSECPERLIVAKMDSLIRKGLVSGTARFRMRGDFNLTDAGRAVLESTPELTPPTETPAPE